MFLTSCGFPMGMEQEPFSFSLEHIKTNITKNFEFFFQISEKRLVRSTKLCLVQEYESGILNIHRVSTIHGFEISCFRFVVHQVKLAERSKAPDLSSGTRKCAWVRTPHLTKSSIFVNFSQFNLNEKNKYFLLVAYFSLRKSFLSINIFYNWPNEVHLAFKEKF